MHELALAQNIKEIILNIAKSNHAPKVLSATIRLGAMTHVDPETLAFAFEAITKESLLEGCVLIYENIPLVAECPKCGWKGEMDPREVGCKECDNSALKLVSGREFQLSSIDVED
ncbi:hydrogenase maturation nickel metallochaperone HypA [Myxococcota bacterium]|nr:hydrogenase maturation nickel metallochaperone HypA [Myxococcota bacterium]